MKKFLCLVLTLCIFTLSFVGCAPAEDSSQPVRSEPETNVRQPIQWEDETFKKMVCDSLLKGYDEDIYPEDLDGVTTMYILADKRISLNGRPYESMEPEKPYYIRYSDVMKTENGYEQVDTAFTEVVPMCLNDLKHFSNLEELFIHLVYTEDMSFAAGIPKLKLLTMGCCDIDNLSGIEGCENLKTLYMPYNKISDLSPLVSLNLWDLFLQHNNISDISPMADMTAIPDELVLSYNNISDISALTVNGRNDYFNYLNLRNNNISDISPLADYRGIVILSLTYNNISDVSPLAHLPKDSTIYLRGNPVENPQVLKNFNNLYID